MDRRKVKERHGELFPPVRVEFATGGMYHGPAATLPEICLSLRQAINGAADPWPASRTRDTYRLLMDTLDTWEPTVHPADEMIDAAVKELVRATCMYVFRRAKEPLVNLEAE